WVYTAERRNGATRRALPDVSSLRTDVRKRPQVLSGGAGAARKTSYWHVGCRAVLLHLAHPRHAGAARTCDRGAAERSAAQPLASHHQRGLRRGTWRATAVRR